MTSLTSDASAPEQVPSEDARRATASFGMWVFIASEAMFFGGLLFAYALGRIRWPQGFAAASRATDVVIGTANTAILLSSSFVVALAVAAGARRQASGQKLVARLLGAAAALGVAFLVLKGFEYRHDWNDGFFPGPGFRLADMGAVPPPQGAELFTMLYFTTTLVHALHLTIGIVWLAVLARRAGRAAIAPSRLEVAGLYWHFVDIMWIFLYPLLYLVARN